LEGWETLLPDRPINGSSLLLFISLSPFDVYKQLEEASQLRFMVDDVGIIEPDGLLGGLMERDNDVVFQILRRDEFVGVEAYRSMACSTPSGAHGAQTRLMASGRCGMAGLLPEHELWGKLSYRQSYLTPLPTRNGQSPV
jgi:hypothetical protein